MGGHTVSSWMQLIEFLTQLRFDVPHRHRCPLIISLTRGRVKEEEGGDGGGGVGGSLI